MPRTPTLPHTRKTGPRAASVNAGTDLATVLAWIKRNADAKVRAGMARFGIPNTDAVGIPVGRMRDYAKSIGRDHALAAALWAHGGYEARMLAIFIDDPKQVRAEQMEAWCRDFDNWAICDTACFHLFDRSAPAWDKTRQWAKRHAEFEKRAAFALLASLALHAKKEADAPFLASLPLIEQAACDTRNFVKKGVSWALRGIGRRNAVLRAEALALAQRLAGSTDPGERWVGKDALRDLNKPVRAK